MKVTVLFCQSDSIYSRLQMAGRKIQCDVWDEKRNALNFAGAYACIHHPPCRLWSRMRYFSTADESEKYFALWSVRHVQRYGGVLEHPGSSSLFKCLNLPHPGANDEFGFTIEVDQFHFGHKARKKTWLYIVGLPDQQNDAALHYKKIPGQPRYVVATSTSDKIDLKKIERSATPIRFAKWLVKIVCKINISKGQNLHVN